MVKFIGGPSVNAYKSYKNHVIAREGQWRIPRNYGSVTNKTKIVIRNYNSDYCSYGSWGNYRLPAWLQWAQFGVDMVQQLWDRFAPKLKVAPTVAESISNPFAKQLEDLEAEVNALKKENEELKKGKDNGTIEGGGVIENNEEVTHTNKDFGITSALKMETKTNTTPDKELTVQILANETKPTKVENKKNTYKAPLWETCAKSYTYTDENGNTVQAQNTVAFRTAFKKATNLSSDIYNVNQINNFPQTLTVNGKEYKFNKSTFTNKENWVEYQTGGTVTEGTTQKQVKKGTTTTTNYWTGTVTATWTDAQGKKQTKTVTISTNDNIKTETDAANHLKTEIKKQVPEEFHDKITINTSENK